MTQEEQLYDTLGELIYLVAIADGVIQPEETKALQDILDGHTWASQITWSFNYEVSKNNDIEDLYKKVLQQCEELGPREEYVFFIEVLEAVADASNGVDDAEMQVMKNFTSELTERLKNDLNH